MAESEIANSTKDRFYDLLPELRYNANNQPQDNSNPASFYESFVSSFYSAFGLVKRHDWDTTNTVIFSYEEKVRMHLALLETFDSSSPYYKEILENFIQILGARASKGSEYPIDEYRKQLENLKKREAKSNQVSELSQGITDSSSEQTKDPQPNYIENAENGVRATVRFLANWNDIRFLCLYMKSEIETSLNALKAFKLDKAISQINPYTSVIGIAWYLPRFIYNTLKIIYHRIVDGNFDYYNTHKEIYFNDLRWIIINLLSFTLFRGIIGSFLTSMGYGLETSSFATSANNQRATIQDLTEYINLKTSQDQIKTAVDSQYQYNSIDRGVQGSLSFISLIGSVLGLSHIVALPIISATTMLVSSSLLYYHNHYYLPQLKVKTHHDPLGLLYDKLITYTESEIERLEKSLEKIKSLNKLVTNNAYLSNYKDKTEEKLEKYQDAYQKLIAWITSDKKDPKELQEAMTKVEEASKIHRRENSVLFAPKSRSSLETIVKPFLAQWNKQGIEKEKEIKGQITEFTESRISKSIVSSTKDIFYNYSQGMSSLFCPFP